MVLAGCTAEERWRTRLIFRGYRGNPFGSLCDSLLPRYDPHIMPTHTAPKRQKRVASEIRGYRRQMEDWVAWVPKHRPMTHGFANGWLLGVMFDQGMDAWTAWRTGEFVAVAFGNNEAPEKMWQRIASTPRTRLRQFLHHGRGGLAVHRYWKRFSDFLPAAASHIVDVYGGDPRKIWRRKRDVEEVKVRLMGIKSIGPQLASMAVLILARNHGLLGGKSAAKSLDVKVDVHIRRVFARSGLVTPNASDSQVVDAARRLAPDYPAALDSGAWDIGRNWCHKGRPNCEDCPLSRSCPKVGVR